MPFSAIGLTMSATGGISNLLEWIGGEWETIRMRCESIEADDIPTDSRISRSGCGMR